MQIYFHTCENEYNDTQKICVLYLAYLFNKKMRDFIIRGKVKVSMAFFITIYPSFKMKKAHNIKYYELIYIFIELYMLARLETGKV